MRTNCGQAFEEPAENIQVELVRDSYDGTPNYPPPEGFSLRLFRPGDRDLWIETWNRSDDMLKVRRKTFNQSFGSNLKALDDRCFFLLDPGGQVIGTGTAWPDPDGVGRAHWVCVDREHQGRGLSKVLLSAVMNRLAQSHEHFRVGTSTFRIPAIALYLSFGFVPKITTEEQARAWRMVAAILPHPALKGI
ncbi:MAG: GNAT family N-acetyltransferase [Planctomycetota bacterium]